MKPVKKSIYWQDRAAIESQREKEIVNNFVFRSIWVLALQSTIWRQMKEETDDIY